MKERRASDAGFNRLEAESTGSIPLHAALAQARRRLAQLPVPDPGLEARLLLEHFAMADATDALTRPHTPIPVRAMAAIDDALRRRATGEPLHRILGWREFHGLRFNLSPETLEPRPDTETLVEAVLPFARETAERSGTCRVLDLGTGTGAIALALLHAVANAEAVGVDLSAGALATAEANARALGLIGRFAALRSDWFAGVKGRFHLIVTNPPYIAGNEMVALDPAVSRFDPPLALDGGMDGLDAYRAIAGAAAGFMEAGGRVAAEIGHSQREAVAGIFAGHGFALVSRHGDLGGNDRVLVFKGG